MTDAEQTNHLLQALMEQLKTHDERARDQSLDLMEIKTQVGHVADTVRVLDEIVLTGRGSQPPLSQAVPQLTMMIEAFVKDQKQSNRERQRLTSTFRAAMIPAVLSSVTALVIAIITFVTQ